MEKGKSLSVMLLEIPERVSLEKQETLEILQVNGPFRNDSLFRSPTHLSQTIEHAFQGPFVETQVGGTAEVS